MKKNGYFEKKIIYKPLLLYSCCLSLNMLKKEEQLLFEKKAKVTVTVILVKWNEETLSLNQLDYYILRQSFLWEKLAVLFILSSCVSS